MIYVFDVDGVITLSKSDIDKEMVECLFYLLNAYKVAFITGGKFKQINNQIITYLYKCNLNNLTIIPLSGSEMWKYTNNIWITLYQEVFTTKEKNKIIESLIKAAKNYRPNRCFFSRVIQQEKAWGAQIEDRGCQITWSAYGQKAPYEIKNLFDIDHKKRIIIKNELEKMIPEFEIRIGGTSSIDITRKGIDKSYGMYKFISLFNLKKEDIIFIGDSLFEGGNDYPVKEMGIKCIEVVCPEETKKFIRDI